jgi:hypothetical protein
MKGKLIEKRNMMSIIFRLNKFLAHTNMNIFRLNFTAAECEQTQEKFVRNNNQKTEESCKEENSKYVIVSH